MDPVCPFGKRSYFIFRIREIKNPGKEQPRKCLGVASVSKSAIGEEQRVEGHG